MDRLEQERLKRMTRAPGADRATRVDDMSSDEDDVSAQGNDEYKVSCWLRLPMMVGVLRAECLKFRVRSYLQQFTVRNFRKQSCPGPSILQVP